jgi:predicted lipoprotein with Yx(FWY)xxD motif
MSAPLTRRLVTGLVALLVVVGVAACGDDSDDSGDSADTSEQTTDTSNDSTTQAEGTSKAAVKVVASELGPVLADAESGFTLYAFEPDTDTNSACTGGCAEAWPPLPGPAEAEDGADPELLGTIVRDDGTDQASYGGHPLYMFAGDEQQGDTTGQGSGGAWFVMLPSGEPLTTEAPQTSTTSSDRY